MTEQNRTRQKTSESQVGNPLEELFILNFHIFGLGVSLIQSSSTLHLFSYCSRYQCHSVWTSSPTPKLQLHYVKLISEKLNSVLAPSGYIAWRWLCGSVSLPDLFCQDEACHPVSGMKLHPHQLPVKHCHFILGRPISSDISDYYSQYY